MFAEKREMLSIFQNSVYTKYNASIRTVHLILKIFKAKDLKGICSTSLFLTNVIGMQQQRAA